MLDQHPTIQSSIQKWMDSAGILQYWDRLSLDKKNKYYVTVHNSFTPHNHLGSPINLHNMYVFGQWDETTVLWENPQRHGEKEIPIGRPCAWI